MVEIMKIFITVISVVLLLSGCAKKEEIDILQKRVTDLDQKFDALSISLNKQNQIINNDHLYYADINKSLKDLQTEMIANQKAQIKNEILNESLKDRLESIKNDLNSLQINQTPKKEKSTVEKQCELEVEKEMLHERNILPSKEWFNKNIGVEGFNLVMIFMLSLEDIQLHSTRDIEFRNGLEDSADELMPMALKQLYDLNSESAKWVALFWRTKARISNNGRIDELIAKYVRQSTDYTQPDIVKHSKEDVELAITTYYYDHKEEIRDMIMISLVRAKLNSRK